MPQLCQLVKQINIMKQNIRSFEDTRFDKVSVETGEIRKVYLAYW